MHAWFEKLEPTNPWVLFMEPILGAAEGNREGAFQVIRKIAAAKLGPITHRFAACVYCVLGDMDRCFALLNRAVDEHALRVEPATYSPLLAGARADPRFHELRGKLRKKLGSAA